MTIEITSVGGYNEVGKNMTAIKIDDEVIILDMGIHLENYIKLTEDEDIIKHSVNELIEAGAIPNIESMKEWKRMVKAICITHAHLDHVGAIPYLAQKFNNVPIYGTPFTIEVIEAILKDERMPITNSRNKVNVNSSFMATPNIKVEFINITHSTPQTAMIALHTKYGIIIYANDFKFDKYPTLGKKPNLKRLLDLGEAGEVHSLIMDSTYAAAWKKTPSETVAKDMLRDVILGTDSTGKLIICTTFSSHISRLKSIVEFGKKLNRKIVFLGRSLSKYVEAAKKAGIIDLAEEGVEIIKFSKKIRKKLKDISSDRKKYLLVMTGHQGEPKASLSRLVRGEFEFDLEKEDHVIFSCTIIPNETNFYNREILEKNLKQKGIRIFKDIHVSGHGAREDLRDLIHLVKPKNIIPAHGNFKMTSALVDLAHDMGYPSEKIHLLQNGDRLSLD
jgi:ribonuclease J